MDINEMDIRNINMDSEKKFKEVLEYERFDVFELK